MHSKSKIACKGCHNLILIKNAQKYHGYSRQCYQKHLLENQSKGPVQHTELSAEEIRFYLHKSQIKFPKIYLYKEFIHIWSLTRDPDLAKTYYLKYLAKIESIVFDLTLTRQESELLRKPYAEVVA